MFLTARKKIIKISVLSIYRIITYSNIYFNNIILIFAQDMCISV